MGVVGGRGLERGLVVFVEVCAAEQTERHQHHHNLKFEELITMKRFSIE